MKLAEKFANRSLCAVKMSPEERQRLARKFKNVTLVSPAQCLRRPGILAELPGRHGRPAKIDPAAALAPIYLHVAGACRHDPAHPPDDIGRCPGSPQD